jgi:hypothetical protein
MAHNSLAEQFRGTSSDDRKARVPVRNPTPAAFAQSFRSAKERDGSERAQHIAAIKTAKHKSEQTKRG